jgi:NADH-quinone oxidoreductase subunit J
MGLVIAFWILAVVTVVAALSVVIQRNVFRAALSLIVCLVSVAGLFITLSADFLAAVQILVYVGAVSVLIILAIMLTREFSRGSPSNGLRFPAFIIAVLFFVVVAYAVVKTNWKIATEAPLAPTTAGLADKLFGQSGYTLPLEIAPVIILAVILGAIVIAREREK